MEKNCTCGPDCSPTAETPNPIKKTLGVLLVIFIIIVSFSLGLIIGQHPNLKTRSATNRGALFPTTEIEETQSPQPTSPSSPTVVSEISLEILSPANGVTVTSPNLAIKGITVARADVFINDLELKADSKGNFTAQLTLDEGENEIIIVANDEDGNVAEKELTVTYSISEWNILKIFTFNLIRICKD